MNRPSVRSEGTNISNEPVTNNNPAIFQNSRLLLNGHGIYSVQEVASSIYQVPQCTNTSFSQTNTSSSATLMAIPLYYPGGVTFTFQQPPPCPHPNGIQTSQYVQQPLQQQQLQQQQRQQILPSYNGQQLSQIDYCTLLKQLEQHIMEKMVVQSQQQCKPYQLRFHCNAGTSTSGLSYPCQENYKTTQTETQRSKRRECGCDCQPQLCLHIETSTTTSPIEPDDQNQSIESSTKTELQECSLKCIQDNKPNSKSVLNKNYIKMVKRKANRNKEVEDLPPDIENCANVESVFSDNDMNTVLLDNGEDSTDEESAGDQDDSLSDSDYELRTDDFDSAEEDDDDFDSAEDFDDEDDNDDDEKEDDDDDTNEDESEDDQKSDPGQNGGYNTCHETPNVVNECASVSEKQIKLKSNKKIKDKLNFSSQHNLSSVKQDVKIQEKDEYEEDSSDEEDIRNTIGNVPLEWYSDYAHLGYDWDGNKIMKPKQGDKLDDFLKRVEDPNFWRTVFEPYTNQNVVLTDEDIQLIQRIQAQRIPDAQFEEYGPWIEWFTSEVEKMPLRKFPEHKRSFIPSRNEAQKVSKLVHALKMGWIKTRHEQAKLRAKKDPQFYMIWSTDDAPEHMRRIHKHIPAPKRHLPGHAESYNPPPEYLFDKKELKQWKKQQTTPWKRKLHFIPEKYNSLREVPSYSRYIRERFQRCLDLYLCPRAIKMKLQIEAEDLVPKLPSPKDLQPFPTTESMVYTGHTNMIRSITIEGHGQYLASGSDDQTVKVWEIATGRCVKTFKFNDVVKCVAWCPNQALSLILVAYGKRVDIVNPGVGDKLVVSKTDSVLEQVPITDIIENDRVNTAVKWENFTTESNEWNLGIRASLHHFKDVTQVTWHGRGDYIASVMPEGQHRSVLISQLSKRRSQLPFSKSKGLIQCVLFHPIKPFLFVATQRNIRIYDLVKQELVKKLLSNSRWISTMAIHPAGDNVLVGTYDRKMLWFDLDLSTKPYQTLRLHGTAVRGVAFHKRYPLFASGSDDRSLIVSHGMVYNDLLKNPLIVPLKRIQNHKQFNDFGIFNVIFHPNQPWLFSSGADATIRLYT